MDRRSYHYAGSYHSKRLDSQYDNRRNWPNRAEQVNPAVVWLFHCLKRREVILLVFLFMLSIVSIFVYFRGVENSKEWIPRGLLTDKRIRGVTSNESSYEVIRKHVEGVKNESLDLKPSEATQVTMVSVVQQSDLEICPGYKNPHLIGELKSVNLSVILMTTVESDIFGKSLGRVRKLVTNTNQLLSKLNRTNPKEYSTSCFNVKNNNKCQAVYPESVVSGAVDVSHSNYTYMAGGHWRPKDCLPRWKVAIIIPYRNRSFHLPIIIKHLTPFLQRQRLEFGFFVVEQGNKLKFNKAMLMNIGFVEALNFTTWDCVIFHDVDHVPINDNNYYGCSGMPKHLMVAADNRNYKLPYSTIFGGVTGFTPGQMFELNGFPNTYWGWGGEDDEMYMRTTAKFKVTRVSNKIGRYNFIKHHHHSARLNTEKFSLFKSFKRRSQYDGLSNLKYEEPNITLNLLYTNISANVQHLPIPGYTPPKEQKIKQKNQNPSNNQKQTTGQNKGVVKGLDNTKANSTDVNANETKTGGIPHVVTVKGNEKSLQSNLEPGVTMKREKTVDEKAVANRHMHAILAARRQVRAKH